MKSPLSVSIFVTLSLVLTLPTHAQVASPTQSTIYLDQSLTQTRFSTGPVVDSVVEYDAADVVFDTKSAYELVRTVDLGIRELQLTIIRLDKEIGSKDPQYEAIRRDVVAVIEDIRTTKNTLTDSLDKIELIEKLLIQGGQKIQETRETIERIKQTITDLSVHLYGISHRFYDSQGNMDGVKLFLNTDADLATTISHENLVRTMVQRLDELVKTMESHQSQQAKRIRVSSENKRRMREEVTNFEGKITNLEQKRKYLLEFMELYRVNRDKMQGRVLSVFDTRKDVHDDIVAAIEEIKTKKYVSTYSFPEKMAALRALEPYAQYERSAELSWPILPVTRIDRKFKDADFFAQYGFQLYGIEIPAVQQTPLYATDDALVYRVVKDDGFGVSWMLLVHENGYMSVYQFPTIILVNEGELVRRGQLLGYSGGEPGTPGAGFISKRPNLTLMLVHNFQFVDPLLHLDISLFESKNDLAVEYKIKYLKDLYRRPRDIYKIDFLPGETLNERRQAFLDRYGVGIYRSLAFWMDANAGSNIDLDLGICIGFAESTLGNYLSTSNNIGNVGNNDRGDRVAYTSPLDGARLIYSTLNNAYLGHYNTIIELNGYGNKNGSIYASSQFNWQNNVVKCLSMVKGYYVPDDFPFRTGPNPRRQ